MALTIGELVGYLDLDDTAWGRGMASARGSVDSFIGFAHGQFGRLALQVAAMAGQITTAVTAASAVGGVAASAAGAAMLLPAALVATKIATAAVAIATQGFADALAETDPAKFAAAVAEMPPHMRDAALAARELAPAWDAVKDSVQQEFWAESGQIIRQLGGTYMPLLKTGLGDVASSFNTAISGAAAFGREAQTQQDVAGIFDATGTSVSNLSAGLQPVLQIIRDIVAVAIAELPGLTDGFGGAATGAAAFVAHARETGQLREWIQGGLATIRQLGTLLHNVAGIVMATFGAFDTAGASSLDLLVDLTGRLRDFLQSAEGQAGLRSLASVLTTVADVAFDVVMVALGQLLPAVVELAPAAGMLAGQIGGTLVTALQVAGPLLQGLAAFLASNMDWLGPLAIALYGAAQAFDVVSTAMKYMNVIAAMNPWILIIAATITLVTLIVTYWDEIVAALGKAWQWIKDAAAAAWDWVVGVARGAAQWIVDMFLSWTLPGLIIKHWDTIVGAFRKAVEWCLDAVDWLKALPGRIGAWFAQAKDWAVRKLVELVDWVRGLPGRVVDAIGDIGGRMVQVGKDIISGIVRGLSNAAGWIRDKLMAIAREAWDAVLNFFGIASPAREGIWAGEMIGRGLALGLARMVGPVGAAAGQLAAAAALPGPGGLGLGLPAAGAPGALPPAGVGAPGSGPLVHIEHLDMSHTTSPRDTAEELWWLAQGRG